MVKFEKSPRAGSNVTSRRHVLVFRPLIQYCTSIQDESFEYNHYISPRTHVEDRARAIRGFKKWAHMCAHTRNPVNSEKGHIMQHKNKVYGI